MLALWKCFVIVVFVNKKVKGGRAACVRIWCCVVSTGILVVLFPGHMHVCTLRPLLGGVFG
jgi:hypothetical protein